MGDVIRRIARAFYERAGEEEKREAKGLFKKLNSNGDGKIKVGDFMKGVDSSSSSQLANEKIFNELDLNRDGALDFDDVLVLFYYKKKKITILRCGGSCRQLIFGPSFSCFQCLFNSVDRRYALCRDCYEGAKFHHQHQLSPPVSTLTSGDLLHDQAILVNLSQLMPKDPKSLTKEKMKKMWETAKSKTGGAASPQLEAMASNLFKSLGINGDNHRVNIQQFSTLMITQESDELEAFLKQRQDSDFATNYMKNELRRVLAQSTTTTTVAHNVATPSHTHTHHVNVAHNVATPSHTHTHRVNLAPRTHHLNRETSSNAIAPILKVATTTFKIVDMALTIASLSGMCTIM